MKIELNCQLKDYNSQMPHDWNPQTRTDFEFPQNRNILIMLCTHNLLLLQRLDRKTSINMLQKYKKKGLWWNISWQNLAAFNILLTLSKAAKSTWACPRQSEGKKHNSIRSSVSDWVQLLGTYHLLHRPPPGWPWETLLCPGRSSATKKM